MNNLRTGYMERQVRELLSRVEELYVEIAEKGEDKFVPTVTLETSGTVLSFAKYSDFERYLKQTGTI